LLETGDTVVLIKNKHMYIVYAKLAVEVDGNDKNEAQSKAGEIFAKIEKENENVKVTEAKVADKSSGYFI